MLDQSTIITAALKLLKRDGYARFSLRRLASTLGIKAPALYWHFPTKNALLAQMAEAVLSDFTPPASPSPEIGLMLLYQDLRARLLDLPDAVYLFRDTPDHSPRRIAFLNASNNYLEALSVAPKWFLTCSNLFLNYVYTFVLDEVRKQEMANKNARQLIRKLELKADDFNDYHEQFRFGLKTIINGLKPR